MKHNGMFVLVSKIMLVNLTLFCKSTDLVVLHNMWVFHIFHPPFICVVISLTLGTFIWVSKISVNHSPWYPLQFSSKMYSQWIPVNSSLTHLIKRLSGVDSLVDAKSVIMLRILQASAKMQGSGTSDETTHWTSSSHVSLLGLCEVTGSEVASRVSFTVLRSR